MALRESLTIFGQPMSLCCVARADLLARRRRERRRRPSAGLSFVEYHQPSSGKPGRAEQAIGERQGLRA